MKPKILANEAAQILGVTPQAIHKQLKTKNLEHAKLRNRIYFEHETSKIIFKDYKQSCKIVTFVLVKGGVGKTTLCRETGIRATLMGKKVLLIDLDHQGNLTKSFNVNANEHPVLIDIFEQPKKHTIKDSIVNVLPGLDLIASRYDNSILDNFLMLKSKNLKNVISTPLKNIKKDYDLILLDCHPSLGQAVTAAVLCADLIVLPTTPCDFSDSGIDITVSEVNRMMEDHLDRKIPLKIVLNKYDNREADSRETYIKLIKHETYGNILFDCYIRKCKDIERFRRNCSSVFDSTTSTPGREDIDIFTRELLDMNKVIDKALPSDMDE